jgi:hypothetical protein
MHRVAVSGGMHGHGFDAHFLAGPDDTKRDFAAIGDQNLGKHLDSPRVIR